MKDTCTPADVVDTWIEYVHYFGSSDIFLSDLLGRRLSNHEMVKLLRSAMQNDKPITTSLKSIQDTQQ